MAALGTRAEIARAEDYYLTSTPLTGEMAKALPGWIEPAISGQQPTVELINEAGEKIGCGYEFSRECKIELLIGPGGRPQEFTWIERVLVMRSESLLKSQAAGLAKRLARGIEELRALTPEPGRGRRQYRDEESLQEAVNQVIEKYGLFGLVEIAWQTEEQREMRYVGRGRGGANRKQQEVITRRVRITSVKRKKAAIAAHCKRLGWQALLTNAPLSVSLNQCVNHYRANWRGERNYHLALTLYTGLGVKPAAENSVFDISIFGK
jgi:hypothetical protein